MENKRTRTEYIRRINRAIEFIAQNLDRNISLDDIAESSHFSSYHFHRIFHGLVGETVNDFVSRKRMEKAAATLVCRPELSITEIAMAGGYSSGANFSKAFKLYFGVSPSQLRNPHEHQNSKIGKIHSKYGKAFDPRDLYSQSITDAVVFDPNKLKEILMNVRVEELDEKPIAYLTAPKGYELEAIFETWDKVIQWAEAREIHDQEGKRYAICHDNPMITPTDKCRYDAAIVVGDKVDVAAPFARAVIPAGRYAIAHYKGDGDKVSKFYMELYSSWLPDSGFEPDNYPPVAHYLNDSRKDGFVEMEVQIKLKALAPA